MDNIEAAIQKLRKNILDKYEKNRHEIQADFEQQEADSMQRFDDKMNALIKELDDRLALMRQFPSVLDADVVTVKEMEIRSSYDERISCGGEDITQLKNTKYPAKWKILVMAKKLG